MYKKNSKNDILIDIYTPCVVEKFDTSREILEHIKNMCVVRVACVCIIKLLNKTLNKNLI